MIVKLATIAALLCALSTPTSAVASCVPPSTPAPGQDPQCFAINVQEPNGAMSLGMHVPAAAEGMLLVSYPASSTVGFGAPVPDMVSRTWIYQIDLPAIKVVDSRPGGKSWSLSGQLTSVTSPLEARWFGWEPRVIAPGSGAVAGALLPPDTYSPTNLTGLATGRLLASAIEGHSGIGVAALVNAHITAWVPMAMPTGDYSATLTITMMG